jgi:hypothetical protein
MKTKKMKTGIKFQDSHDDSELTVTLENDGDFSLTIGNEDVWFTQDDFEEFVRECTSFAAKIKAGKQTDQKQ